MAFWIQTHSTRTFRLDRPSPLDVDIHDIAHSLALQNRFNGHTIVPYSVAQHCVLVSRIVEQRAGEYPAPEIPINEPLLGLLHDAHEAYTGDLVSPVKRLISNAWQIVEDNAESAVQMAFALPCRPSFPQIVRDADMIALATEVRDLMPTPRGGHPIAVWKEMPAPLDTKIIPIGWGEARDQFLTRFAELTRR